MKVTTSFNFKEQPEGILGVQNFFWIVLPGIIYLLRISIPCVILFCSGTADDKDQAPKFSIT